MKRTDLERIVGHLELDELDEFENFCSYEKAICLVFDLGEEVTKEDIQGKNIPHLDYIVEHWEE